MTTFFLIAGIIVTLLGIAAIATILVVFFYVRVLGYPITLKYVKNDPETSEKSQEED